MNFNSKNFHLLKRRAADEHDFDFSEVHTSFLIKGIVLLKGFEDLYIKNFLQESMGQISKCCHESTSSKSPY